VLLATARRIRWWRTRPCCKELHRSRNGCWFVPRPGAHQRTAGDRRHDAYKSAAWAWVKALLGIGTFEGTLLTVGASARHAASSRRWRWRGAATPFNWRRCFAPNGRAFDTATLALVNIVLAVWRPRLYRSGASAAVEEPAPIEE